MTSLERPFGTQIPGAMNPGPCRGDERRRVVKRGFMVRQAHYERETSAPRRGRRVHHEWRDGLTANGSRAKLWLANQRCHINANAPTPSPHPPANAHAASRLRDSGNAARRSRHKIPAAIALPKG